jgi:hypothetical protein
VKLEPGKLTGDDKWKHFSVGPASRRKLVSWIKLYEPSFKKLISLSGFRPSQFDQVY